MDAVTRSLLEAAILAPSGENAQPWRFRVRDSVIELHNAPESDQSLYNVHEYGTLVSHGAAIENMSVAAAAHGYSLSVTLFPDSSTDTHIASLALVPPDASSAALSRLNDSLPLRVTNRKVYATTPIPSAASAYLTELETTLTELGVDLIRVRERSEIQALARVASVNEEVMLGNKSIHDFFFDHVTWTEAEDGHKRSGFYIKTLELPLPIQWLFRLLKHWSVMQILSLCKFPTLVGVGNAATYAASAELGVLRAKIRSPESYIQLGRAFERVWLTLASQGVSFQPLVGALFLYMASHENPNAFSPKETTLLNDAYRTFLGVTQCAEGDAVVAFRIGLAQPPSAKSRRFPLEHFLL